MVFTSVVFLFYFLPIALLYHILPKNIKLRNFYLLVLSLLFYTYGEGKNIVLMLSAILISHLGAVGVYKYQKQKNKILFVSVFLMLAQLFVFKYLGFCTSILANFADITQIEIALPIGISFFTFQAISYVVDVYRGIDTPANSVLDAALYVSLFPQLVAGPIVRYDTVAEEIKSRSTTLDGFTTGIDRFIKGFAMKMLLSNQFAKISDAAFNMNSQNQLYMAMAAVGAVAYTLHIYYDFCAYSHMAIGLGKMFGFNFLENFNYPYISKSIKEFWTRWHISLSSYFKDYVYIPLGGSRRSSARNVFNLLFVWFLTGMWHGAGFNFIAWGLYYAALLMIERYIIKGRFQSHIITMILVIIGWIFFRAEGITLAIRYLKSFFNFTAPMGRTWYYYITMYKFEWIAGLALIGPWINNKLSKHKTIYRIILIALFLLSIARLITDGFNPFIYFRF